MKKFLIADFYVDEPACLGVPPFISPYPRYVAGALIDAGIDPDNIDYLTIDDIRGLEFKLAAGYDMVFLIGGASVPGRYLGYKIGTLSEIVSFISKNEDTSFACGGLIGRVISDRKNMIAVKHEIEQFAFNYAQNKMADTPVDYKRIGKWAIDGAHIITRHFEYPNLVAEIETYRGCPRTSHCSFCSEALFGRVEFRPAEEIFDEITKLISLGISRFRLGKQADILAYRSDLSSVRNGFPKPVPDEIIPLLRKLQSLRESGAITLLNVDNANPGTMINFPEESRRIIEALADALTEGDTLPLGIESFDQNLLKQNNLKVTREEALRCIKMINDIGGRRRNGIPVLLPGVNLLHGLIGETVDTFRINYETLKEILDSGLLLKRINIRKISPFPDTMLYNEKLKQSAKVENRYDYYKQKIRDEIDNEMLKKIYPYGTILKGLRIEDVQHDYSYGRQLASYSIISRIHGIYPKKGFIDVVITGHRERSLSALKYPIKINSLNDKALEMIPGVGKKKSDIVLNKPIKDAAQLLGIVPNIKKEFLDKIDFS